MRPKSNGIVHHRHEEVGGRHQRLLVVQPPDRGVVAGLGPDQQVGKRRRAACRRGSRPARRARSCSRSRRRGPARSAAARHAALRQRCRLHGDGLLGLRLPAPIAEAARDDHVATSIEVIAAADPETLAAFDAVIDVRSPAEFAEDHVPGAINLPVLSDAERAEVGDDLRAGVRLPGQPHRRGAGRPQHRPPPGDRAGRQGRRVPARWSIAGAAASARGAMATILSQVGWRTALLAGGYRTYRRLGAGAALRRDAAAAAGAAGRPHRLGQDRDPGAAGRARRADRSTWRRWRNIAARCSAAWPASRSQARRCSSRGCWPRWTRLDPARPVVVEAESSKVGERMVPPVLWQAMPAAPRIALAAPLAERARVSGTANTPISSPTVPCSTPRWPACRSTRPQGAGSAGARSPTPATSRRSPPS